MKVLKVMLLGGLGVVGGCTSEPPPRESPPVVRQETPPAAATNPGDSATSIDPAVAPPSPKISLEVASWDNVLAMIAKHQGQVVVVDLWSTSCIPCLREFPRLVELHKQSGEQVACLSVSVDYTGAAGESPESLRDKVAAFLEKREATFENVICSDPDSALYDRLELAAVPAVLVYDRAGMLRKRFDNDTNEYGEEGFTYAAQIVPLVESLLKE